MSDQNKQVVDTDLLIIGAGPAGLSAAVYGSRAGRSVTVLEAGSYGGQIVNTPDIENYPAIRRISGFDFSTALYEQAKELGANVVFARATGIVDEGETKLVTTSGQEDFRARAVVIATGAKNRQLGIERETDMIGHGVSYCATCDGMFFRGKDVAVNGGGNTAVEDAAYLANICNKVYLIHRRDQFRAPDLSVNRLRELPNVEFVLNSTVESLQGDDMLSGVVVKDKATGQERTLEVSALFVAVGQVPDNDAFASVVELDPKGYVVAGEDCHTRTPGVFVAGDCRTKEVRQVVTATSDGAAAALAACAYIG